MTLTLSVYYLQSSNQKKGQSPGSIPAKQWPNWTSASGLVPLTWWLDKVIDHLDRILESLRDVALYNSLECEQRLKKLGKAHWTGYTASRNKLENNLTTFSLCMIWVVVVNCWFLLGYGRMCLNVGLLGEGSVELISWKYSLAFAL